MQLKQNCDLNNKTQGPKWQGVWMGMLEAPNKGKRNRSKIKQEY